LWLRAVGLLGWHSVEKNNFVGHVGCHDKVVFDDEGGALRAHDPTLHDLGSDHTLFGVEVSTWLIDQVNIAWLGKTEHNSHTLELATRQSLHLIVKQALDVQRVKHLSLKESRRPRVLELEEKEIPDSSFELRSDGLWLVAHIKAR